MCDFILFFVLSLNSYVIVGELMYVWNHRGWLACKEETKTRKWKGD
jgi:hypothetical protein